MADVPLTFLWCHSLPELLYTVDELLLVCWFNETSQVVLQFVPDHLNGIQVRTFCWSRPVIDVLLLDESHS